ncbi:hypothetical protein [Calycomorphotria hydatis]|nr:hypothetical protein [Calycomorphotria hydatis]
MSSHIPWWLLLRCACFGLVAGIVNILLMLFVADQLEEKVLIICGAAYGSLIALPFYRVLDWWAIRWLIAILVGAFAGLIMGCLIQLELYLEFSPHWDALANGAMYGLIFGLYFSILLPRIFSSRYTLQQHWRSKRTLRNMLWGTGSLLFASLQLSSIIVLVNFLIQSPTFMQYFNYVSMPLFFITWSLVPAIAAAPLGFILNDELHKRETLNPDESAESPAS